MAESLRAEAARLDWGRAEWLHSLLCLPGAALPLSACLLLGHPGTAVLMAGGAQCVGFGSYQQQLFRPWGAMLAASAGIAVSAAVGTMCRDSTAALLCAAMVWAFVYGLSNSISSSTAWVGQQCCVFLVVFSAAPASPGSTHDLIQSALLRGAGVLAGGLLQTASLSALLRWKPQAETHFSSPDFDRDRFHLSFLREQIAERTGPFHYAMRMTATAAAAIALYRTQTWNNAYWIGMTAMLLPKPEFSQTALRSLLRVVGTLAGAAVSTMIVVALHPRGEVLAVLTLAFLFGSYLLINVNYGAFSVVLTGYICFLLAIVHDPPREVLEHRLVATTIGAALAVGVHLLFIGARRMLGITAPSVRTLEQIAGYLPALREHKPSA